MPFLAAGVCQCCSGIHVNGIASEGLYECFRCSIYGALGWVFELVARTDGLISRLQVFRCVGWLCNTADSFRNVLENRFSINMCFDMSEMFVSSLWEGDFDKLFTVMCAFKRGSRLSCVYNHFCLLLRLSPELTVGQTCNKMSAPPSV